MTKSEIIRNKYGHAIDHLYALKRKKQDTMMAIFDFLNFINQEEDKKWIAEMFKILHLIMAQTEKILIEKYTEITNKNEQNMDMEKI